MYSTAQTFKIVNSLIKPSFYRFISTNSNNHNSFKDEEEDDHLSEVQDPYNLTADSRSRVAVLCKKHNIPAPPRVKHSTVGLYYAELKAQNNNCTLQEANERWKAEPEFKKKAFLQKANNIKQRFKKEKALYFAKLTPSQQSIIQTQTSYMSKHLRNKKMFLSPRILFIFENADKINLNYNLEYNIDNICRLWNNLPAEEKQDESTPADR